MAVEPKDLYPSQTLDSDSGWPYGKARNDTEQGATDGTPLEAQWLNDLWGFFQALLTQASASPSGSPDHVGASQYLNAIRTVIQDDVSESGTTRTAMFAAIVENLLVPSAVSPPLIPVLNANDRFTPQYETDDAPLEQTDASGCGKLVIPFGLPFTGMSLSEDGVSIQVKGAAGHGGLPGTMPTFAFFVRTYAGTGSGAPTQIGATVTDASATVGAYEDLHTISLTFNKRAILASDQFLLVISGEAGANAIAGLKIYNASLGIEAS